MSYILEALKKAQAERQLGNAPTIHAPQPAQAAQPGAGASRKPLFIGLGAGALVVAAGALFLWQRAPSPAAPAVAPAVAPLGQAGEQATAPAAPPAVLAPSGQGRAATPAIAASSGAPASTVAAPAPARAPAAKTTSVASNTLQVSAPPAPAPRPAHVAEPPVPPAAPAAGRAGADTLASAASARSPATAAAPTLPPPAAAARRTAIAPAAAPSPEDSLPYLSQLPDAIQREVPRVSFGGYMYSANPADRLLLVDKALRHEGEEVAPGLLLEKLLPKAAVMNYRGVRYRVAY
jgi:general secretion pathway protein B